jgi:hypothetical protein
VTHKSDRDVLVVATDEEFWRFHVECKRACKKARAGARYIAFYRLAPMSAITHYACVRTETRNVHPDEIFRDCPSLRERYKTRGRCALYEISDPIPLSPPIEKAAAERPIHPMEWTTLAQLHKAKTLQDLREE